MESELNTTVAFQNTLVLTNNFYLTKMVHKYVHVQPFKLLFQVLGTLATSSKSNLLSQGRLIDPCSKQWL